MMKKLFTVVSVTVAMLAVSLFTAPTADVADALAPCLSLGERTIDYELRGQDPNGDGAASINTLTGVGNGEHQDIAGNPGVNGESSHAEFLIETIASSNGGSASGQMTAQARAINWYNDDYDAQDGRRASYSVTHSQRVNVIMNNAVFNADYHYSRLRVINGTVVPSGVGAPTMQIIDSSGTVVATPDIESSGGNGVFADESIAPVPLSPGSYTIEVTFEGHRDVEGGTYTAPYGTYSFAGVFAFVSIPSYPSAQTAVGIDWSLGCKVKAAPHFPDLEPSPIKPGKDYGVQVSPLGGPRRNLDIMLGGG